MQTITLTLLAAILLASCQSSEIANSKDVNPNAIHIAYSVTYTEGEETVTCRATFRFGGNKGTTLVLNSPTKIQLDGQTIKVDSSKFFGAYYQVEKPFAAFAGKHEFTFFNANGSSLKEGFVFKPFSLVSSIPPAINKKDWTLNFKGLEDGSKINIAISDTSTSTEDIGREFTIHNNQATVPVSEIALLKKGPLEISIYKHSKKSLQQSSPEGGEIFIGYSLKARKTILKG